MPRQRLILLPFAFVLLLIICRFVASAFAQPTAAQPVIVPTATALAAYPGPATPVSAATPTASPVSYPAQSGHAHVVHQSDVLPSPTPFPTRTPIPTRVVPPIRAVQPKDHGSLSPLAPVQITFGREVDRASVEAAFTLSPTVAGRFEWQASRLVFRPASGMFAERTAYTLTLATTARTATGEPLLAEPLSSMFHTTPFEDDVAWFGGGADVQVIPAEGRRAVQYAVSVESSAASFELYALNDEQFLSRYEQLVSETEDYSVRRAIPIGDAPLVARWPASGEPGVSNDNYGEPLWLHETQLPAEAPPGLYVLNLNVGRLNDQLLVAISRNALTLRRAEGQLTAWLANEDGAASEAEVSVFGRGGAILARGRTDAEGLLRLGPLSGEPLLAVARHNEDVTIAGFGEAWRTSVGYRSYGQPQHVAYMFTDRRLYTPGEAVNFKAFVRRERDGAIELLPEGTPVTVKLLRWSPEEWNWSVARTQTLLTNSFGAVEGRFELAAATEPGDHALQLVIGGDSFQHIFKVQAPVTALQVSVKPEAGRYVAGEAVRVTVEVRDAAGNPLPETGVTLRSYTTIPNYYGRSNWSNGWMGDGSSLTRRTDAAGRATFEFTAMLSEWDSTDAFHTGLVGLEATVQVQAERATGFGVIRVASAAEQITIEGANQLHAAGAAVPVSARVTTLDGQPVPGRSLAVELLRWNPNEYAFSTLVRAASTQTDANGIASTTLTAEAGRYQVRVTGFDARRKMTRVYRELTVVGTTVADDNLLIAADRNIYRIGETAGLTIASPVNGPAWLTIERGSVRRTQLITLTAPLTRVAVPIEPGDAPNIFVNVYAWMARAEALTGNTYYSLRERALRTASVNLHIEQPEKALTVTLTPNAASYAPGDHATFTVRVTDARGNPVSAEVALALVSDSAAAWGAPLAGSFHHTFHHSLGLTVEGFDSYAPLRDFFEWGGGCGGCGGEWYDGQMPSGLSGLTTAGWASSLRTDWNGEATLTLPLPKLHANWRATAIAATADAQVGEMSVVIEVK